MGTRAIMCWTSPRRTATTTRRRAARDPAARAPGDGERRGGGLMERDVPTRMLADDAAPFYYSQNSWEAEQEIPWNAEADRPMSLAEGIAWVHDNAKPPRKRRR